MSDDDRTSLESIVQALFHGSLGKFVVWLRWLVVCVITGTIAVVGFVIEVRNGVKEAQAAADRNTRRIELIEARQQTTNDLVQQHQALLNLRGGE
jgi:uncharacterized membrane protein YdfJ with MMPL/SSD domain